MMVDCILFQFCLSKKRLFQWGVKTISFITGKKIREKKTNFKGFRSRDTVDLGVYAGGRMAGKGDIVDEVRQRHLRILKDII